MAVVNSASLSDRSEPRLPTLFPIEIDYSFDRVGILAPLFFCPPDFHQISEETYPSDLTKTGIVHAVMCLFRIPEAMTLPEVDQFLSEEKTISRPDSQASLVFMRDIGAALFLPIACLCPPFRHRRNVWEKDGLHCPVFSGSDYLLAAYEKWPTDYYYLGQVS